MSRNNLEKYGLLLAALFSISLAIWFVMEPAQEKEQARQTQAALLESVQQQDNCAATPTEADETAAQDAMGVLRIGCIDLELPVVEGVSEAQLEVAAGHVPQTAAIGETGNAVIAGHRSYIYGEQFNRLGELQPGDMIQYQSKNGETMRFVVDDLLEVEPGDQAAFAQPDDRAQLTLYTCTPVRTATHRLLVRATRIDH